MITNLKREDGQRYEELRRDIAVGMEEIKQGNVAPFDIEAIKAKGRKLLTQRRKAAKCRKCIAPTKPRSI